jgi:hypothetical protein
MEASAAGGRLKREQRVVLRLMVAGSERLVNIYDSVECLFRICFHHGNDFALALHVAETEYWANMGREIVHAP